MSEFVMVVFFRHLFGASPRETLSSLSLSLKRSSSFLVASSSSQISLQNVFGQDLASIQSLLKILLHFAEAGEDWLAGMQSQQSRGSKNRSCEVGTQTISEKRKVEGFVDHWPNVVQIRPSQERGSAIRMNCPPVSAIAVFCPALAKRMEVTFHSFSLKLFVSLISAFLSSAGCATQTTRFPAATHEEC